MFAALPAQSTPYQPISEARVRQAYEDARAACSKVLGVAIEAPELVLAEPADIAEVAMAESLQLIRLRQPDEALAARETRALGAQVRFEAYAKYSWSRKQVMVVSRNWSLHARLLKRPAFTADQTLRAVLVHELCHALDDRRFDLVKCLQKADSYDAAVALNAVIEGHAQLMTRRICSSSGLAEGFAELTAAIGAAANFTGLGSALMEAVRQSGAGAAHAYVEGERFVDAVLAARPDTGLRDLFESPPTDGHTISRPEWYLRPASRPQLRYAVAPLLAAFETHVRTGEASASEWLVRKITPDPRHLCLRLHGVAESERLAVAEGILAARQVELSAPAIGSLRQAWLVAIEFAAPELASRFVAHARTTYLDKADTMERGLFSYRDVTCHRIERPTWQGQVAELDMMVGITQVDCLCVDGVQDRLVLALYFHVDPPSRDAATDLTERLFGMLGKR